MRRASGSMPSRLREPWSSSTSSIALVQRCFCQLLFNLFDFCSLGDQFARWTNDVFKSTMHRAINRSGRERYSIPLFFGTDYDVRLEPIPTCVSPDTPAKYEVVTAGEYVKSRLEATYAHSQP
ncbi:hypothetical protein HGRIS_013005 [Hohenbuehelia grisea]|uniref:Isopenicillin N synthase-like Fe(2+) 2OG dioxygenase domain-containing protein n=1 Tax=Hohenbuehelia grisea TaxID=104357 RepID=A0ABR3IU57_9AGAR